VTGAVLANEDRGERLLSLGKRSYRLRPSWEACKAIETQTERSIIALSLTAAAGVLPLAIAAVVATQLIRAGAEDDLTKGVSAEGVEKLIFEAGILNVQAPLAEALKAAATGGVDASGEAKAPEASGTTTGA
jgi:hypothetical protein